MKNSKSNSSNTGYRGIFFRKDSGMFKAYIQSNKYLVDRYGKTKAIKNRQIVIGNYDTLKEAIEARENFITKLY